MLTRKMPSRELILFKIVYIFLWTSYISSIYFISRALVFVVDSTTLQKDLKDVALYLYDCLVDDQMSKAKLKILIVCNKQGKYMQIF